MLPLPSVLANEARLGQVFVNLLVNALQALPERPVADNVIRVATRLVEGEAVVEISDNGVGIASDVLPRIFDPFFTTKPVGVGTGLGLSISHAIVTALGGKIEVDSQPGMGTTFRILLPVTGQRVSEKTPVPPARTSTQERARIMVVDDEPLVAKALARMLSAYDVVIATDGATALDVLQKGRFDVVLCDVMMPGMTGMELFEAAVRQHPELARRFVFLTGGTFTPEAREFLDRAGTRRVEKPFDLDALTHVIRQVLTPS
jgi:CheY-like chemotaxis protein